jgi:hypothetical protein
MSNKTTIERSKLETFISKYHLGGLINQVVWNYNGKTLSTKFVSETRTLLGNVSWAGFSYKDPFDIGIYNTEKLVKMIGILEPDISLDVISTESVAKALHVKDKKIDVHYILSKLDVIPQVPDKAKLPDFDVTLVINKDFIERFIKGCAALPEVGTFTLDVKKTKTTLTLGYTSVESNNIVFDVNVEDVKPISKVTFPSALFKEVLSANKNAKETLLHVSEKGLARVIFKEDDYESTYNIVAVEEV